MKTGHGKARHKGQGERPQKSGQTNEPAPVSLSSLSGSVIATLVTHFARPMRLSLYCFSRPSSSNRLSIFPSLFQNRLPIREPAPSNPPTERQQTQGAAADMQQIRITLTHAAARQGKGKARQGRPRPSFMDVPDPRATQTRSLPARDRLQQTLAALFFSTLNPFHPLGLGTRPLIPRIQHASVQSTAGQHQGNCPKEAALPAPAPFMTQFDHPTESHAYLV